MFFFRNVFCWFHISQLFSVRLTSHQLLDTFQFVANFVDIRVFQSCTCDQCFNLTQVPNLCWSHCGCLCAYSVDRMADSRTRVMAQEQNSARPSTIFHQLVFAEENQQLVLGSHRFSEEKWTIYIGRETTTHILPTKLVLLILTFIFLFLMSLDLLTLFIGVFWTKC